MYSDSCTIFLNYAFLEAKDWDRHAKATSTFYKDLNNETSFTQEII